MLHVAICTITNCRAEQLPPLVVTPQKQRKKPQPLKKPRVARTDSTKPLMGDETESPTDLTG